MCDKSHVLSSDSKAHRLACVYDNANTIAEFCPHSFLNHTYSHVNIYERHVKQDAMS